MFRLTAAAKTFFAEIKTTPAPYRKLFGVFFAVSLAAYLLVTFLKDILNGGELLGTILGFIVLYIGFLLYRSFCRDDKSFKEAAKATRPSDFFKLAAIFAVVNVPTFLINGVIVQKITMPAFGRVLCSLAVLVLSVFGECLQLYAAKKPDKNVSDTLSGGLSLVGKALVPLIVMDLVVVLITFAISFALAFPFTAIFGGENSQSIILFFSQIFAVIFTFFYSGVFFEMDIFWE
ncbi:MAG: hypothetical protein LBL87_05150 [Ruminococcus sp.]|jgi:hypothetical protein|nr:hypothetical protein [Ruminococcus sp.]